MNTNFQAKFTAGCRQGSKNVAMKATQTQHRQTRRNKSLRVGKGAYSLSYTILEQMETTQQKLCNKKQGYL